MRLWGFEARKMFRMNRGTLVIALFILAELAILIFTDAPVNSGAALYREQYLSWLKKVEGPWTQEKAALLEGAARDSSGAGEGFDVLYKQYLYVNEGRENRYFLDSNGWAGLLADRAPDLPLAAAIILLCVPVYCGEASCGMEPLALTSREGRRLFTRQKIALALAVTAALSLSSDLLRLGFFWIKYGLPDGGYPMQSVESLGGAGKAVSLWGAHLLSAGLRLLGSAELALITLFLSARCGQFALSAFLSTAAAVLPWVGLDRSVQYALPLPSSLLAPAGFLRGSEYETDMLTGERTAVFREADWRDICLVAAMAAAVCAVCALLLRKRYETALSGPRGAGRRRTALCLALALCLTLTGCAGAAPDPVPDTVYNSRERGTYEYNDLTVSAENGEITVTDSEGSSSPLIRDTLKHMSGDVYYAEFYAAGKYVYLWREASPGYGQKLASDTGKAYVVSLLRVDLDTFISEVVFETVTQHTVLGIDVPVSDAARGFHGGGDFFVDENYVYILGSGLRRVELRTGRVSALDIPSNRNVAFDGRNIYYISPSGALTRYDTKTGGTATANSGPVLDFRLTSEGLTVT